MARTYEELLSAQTELAHFNPNHDPRNGQFAKGHGGVSSATSKSKTKAKTQEKLKRDPEESKKTMKKAVAIGAASTVGLTLMRAALVKAGNTALRELGHGDMQVKPDVVSMGMASVKDALAITGLALLISDANSRSKQRKQKVGE